MNHRLKEGDVFAGHTLREYLGGGGNGKVWRAVNLSGNEVAIKILVGGLNRGDGVPRFRREVSALVALRGEPGIVPLFDHSLNPTNGPPWFTMPVATPLAKRLGKEATLEQVCVAVRDFAVVLARLHERGISHRDIKPGNLFWFGNEWCLGDFGLVDMPEAEALTLPAQRLGPAYFIAPEMLNEAGVADGAKADVYSLGKTLWVLATGLEYPFPGEHQPQFAGAQLETYSAHARAALLQPVLYQMTRLDPRRRPTAAVVKSELAGWLEPSRPAEGPRSLEDSLASLRRAVVPHNETREETTRLADLASRSLASLAIVAKQIVFEVARDAGLQACPLERLPAMTGYIESLGTPTVIWSGAGGWQCVAGSRQFTAMRFGLYTKADLTSDGIVHLCAGFLVDRFHGGYDLNHMDEARPWRTQKHAIAGTANCDNAVVELQNAMREELPNAVNMFAERVRNLR